MSYCTNCGAETGAEHRYCGQCGHPQTSSADDDAADVPPSATAAWRDGFLSGRSVVFLSDVLQEKAELDRDSVEYAQLVRDVGAALSDFCILANIEEVNLLNLAFEYSTAGGEWDATDPADLNSHQQQRQLAWLGFFKLPALYDRQFGFEWEDELNAVVQKLIDEYGDQTAE